jgi:aminomuconate-semialdehyde/2-hydroxymuconate-6-semialdehyde dehydrogenase
MEKILNYIDGELRAPATDNWLDVMEPATATAYGQLSDSGDEDLESAVAAARAAFPAWSQTPAEERGRMLRRLARKIESMSEPLALAESIDTGKPIAVTRKVDIPRAARNLHFFADAASQFASESHHMEAGAINYTLRMPLGVVACISPWNLPLYLLTWKIAPALAAGNCVIAKPSEITPVTAWLFSRLCQEAGLPPGVLNIIHGKGPGIGQAIVGHPGIKAISFTGGSATGATIARTAAPEFKKLSLELGGKNPSIVFADADWESMMNGVVRAGYSNQGQICLCGSRVLVEASIYEKFRDEFVARVAALKIGDPLNEETEQGAIVSLPHRDKILDCIEQARQAGGNILTGGAKITPDAERCRDGWFVEPTVIDGLAAESDCNQEEIFGPVVSLIPFADEEQALAIANGTRYGLAASVWSSDVSRCHRMAEQLQAGLIWVNTWMLRDLRTPMGGLKNSGVGREGGLEAMRFFTEARNVCIKYR